ncbi:MAG: outer membrane lipoprotein carrier protein LolA [Bacteroidales bacterium]|nr:outer membrane lipoprotein carrier protein LolA [Bacteroidales bacterium]
MKKTLFLFALLLSCMMLLAQSAGDVEQTGDKRSVLTASIEKAHKQMTSLSAQFTQRKSSTLFTEDAVQKGKLNYKSPKMLRWEYTSPKAMTVIFANGKVMLKTDKGTVQNPNKMLNEMGTMIISTINGSFLNDASNFSARYYKNSKSGAITVVLTPVNKRIKAYYSKMTISLDAKTLLADKVVMQEVNGDITTITFSDKKTNLTLSDSLFK